MPASPFLDRRILILCHALPDEDTPRLWRWIEAAQRLGELWLLTPAGPALHLRQWTRLDQSATRLAIEPAGPLARPRRYRRTLRQWCRQTTFDAAVATAPGVANVLEARNIPVKLADKPAAPPAAKRGEPMRLPFRGRVSAPRLRDGWTVVAGHDDPLFALEQRLAPRSVAA